MLAWYLTLRFSMFKIQRMPKRLRRTFFFLCTNLFPHSKENQPLKRGYTALQSTNRSITLSPNSEKNDLLFLTSLFFDNSSDLKHDQPTFNHPGVQLEDKESIAAIFKHINDLPDNQKTALILHKIENKTQVEVAEIMQTSPKAIESLIQRAKTNLSKKLNTNEG